MENQNKEHKVTAFDKVMFFVGKLQDVFSIIPLIAMCFIVLACVIMRYVLKTPFTWGEEASRYLMIFAAMIAIGMGVREKAHLGVTMFTDALRGKAQLFVKAFAQILNLAIYGVLAYLSFEFVVAQKMFGQVSAALKIPMYIVYSIMLMGFVFSCIETVYVIYRDFIRKDPLETKEEIST